MNYVNKEKNTLNSAFSAFSRSSLWLRRIQVQTCFPISVGLCELWNLKHSQAFRFICRKTKQLQSAQKIKGTLWKCNKSEWGKNHVGILDWYQGYEWCTCGCMCKVRCRVLWGANRLKIVQMWGWESEADNWTAADFIPGSPDLLMTSAEYCCQEDSDVCYVSTDTHNYAGAHTVNMYLFICWCTPRGTAAVDLVSRKHTRAQVFPSCLFTTFSDCFCNLALNCCLPVHDLCTTVLCVSWLLQKNQRWNLLGFSPFCNCTS